MMTPGPRVRASAFGIPSRRISLAGASISIVTLCAFAAISSRSRSFSVASHAERNGERFRLCDGVAGTLFGHAGSAR
jgi:hypothetical protein